VAVAGRLFPASGQSGSVGRKGPRYSLRSERGVALVLALLSMTVVLALGGALTVLMATEVTIAARFRDGLEAFHAAEAGIARAMIDLRTADWDAARAGSSTSSFRDAAFDLASAGRDIDSVAGRAGWQPYAYGRFSDMLPGTDGDRRLSVVVWVAADPIGDDNLIVVRAHAYGPGGVRRMVESTVERTPGGLRVVAWREGP
jgi:hypothetical protein